MKDQDKGIFKKYEVKKLSNPDKKLDCVVLEFDNQLDRIALKAWVGALKANEYEKLAAEVLNKLQAIDSSDLSEFHFVKSNPESYKLKVDRLSEDKFELKTEYNQPLYLAGEPVYMTSIVFPMNAKELDGLIGIVIYK